MSFFGNFSFLSHTLQIPIITISVEASKYKSMISVENYVFLPFKDDIQGEINLER